MEQTEQPLNVLVVDDTIVYRRILREIISSIPTTTIAAAAANGKVAVNLMSHVDIDLVILDVEMPEMDGLEALNIIRRDYPNVGVIMISGLTQRAADLTIQALVAGALDFIPKPDGGDTDGNRELLRLKIEEVVQYFIQEKARRRDQAPQPAKPVVERRPTPTQIRIPTESNRVGRIPRRIDVVGMGVSTGGPSALFDVLPKLPEGFEVPILVVQHMPPLFTASLASSLQRRSKINVVEARNGDTIRPATAYLAPGGRHMLIRRNPEQPGNFIIGLNDNPPENGCRPSVDVLFRSMANVFGGNILAVIMTGMGVDGMRGVQAMKQRSCYCLTQDEQSSVIYGMPRAVASQGLSDESLPLEDLAKRIIQLVKADRLIS